mgnify:CR=1 FL=1
MTYTEKFEKWIKSDKLDEKSRAELLAIRGNEDEMKMRMERDMEFGTGGLRGIMRAGSNGMNVYTVRHASCALAKYLSDNKLSGGVAIAFDSRNNSALFAIEAAKTLAFYGIKTYIFDSLRPTPELSFAVRFLKCSAGIVVTASHNPKEYNGYKVYGDDGAQVVFEAADAIMKNMNETDILEDVHTADEKEAREKGLINTIGAEVDEAFYKAVASVAINPEVIKKANLSFVYTPFHGAGNIPVREVLRRAGVQNIEVVKEQEMPDGNFPTVKSPNPENPEGFALAIKLAKEKNIDIIIGTDPDSDRVGLIVRDKDGNYVPLTGNQTGALLVNYVLSQKKETGTLPQNAAVIKTIVTNEISDKICAHYGADVFNVLTGFKFIAEKIKEFEESGSHTYVFGFEESYGYLPGTYVRDKDAVGASLLIAEMASYYKLRGMSVYDGLCELFEKFGHFGEWVDNIYFEGVDGMERIAAIMNKLRENAPDIVGGSRVVRYSDVLKGVTYNIQNKTEEKLSLPSSNVLRFVTEDGTFIAFRPSGTEPKFKIYTGFVCDDHETKKEALKKDIYALIGR